MPGYHPSNTVSCPKQTDPLHPLTPVALYRWGLPTEGSMVREAPRTGCRSRRIIALCPLQMSPSHPLPASIVVRVEPLQGLLLYQQQTYPLV